MKQTHNIVVIGGGPAGMMAAIKAAQLVNGVALYEKNASLGRKLGLSGKGRCNITNASSLEDFLDKFGSNGLFLRNAFNRFFVPDLFRFFEEREVELKIERQQRVFPATDSSRSVIDCLRKALQQAGVEVRLSSPVRSIEVCDDGSKVIHLIEDETINAQKVIISCGGATFPETGSTGDGIKMASKLGFETVELSPGLVPLETEEIFVKEIRGLTLKNIQLVFQADSKKIKSSIGELLFTHFGVSGPLVLDMSADVDKLLKKSRMVKLLIDLKPGLSQEELNVKLQEEFQQFGPQKLRNYLKEILPSRFVDIFLKFSKINGEKKCHQIESQERKMIVKSLKEFSVTIKRTRPLSEGMVTCGGVSLKEIDPRTMESKKVKGVYFCGEILDLAAASGGFNLQAAFSTGYVAGEAAAMSLKGAD